MPITEADLTLAEMQDRVKKGYLCAVCQSLLTIAWGGSFGINGYLLRCGKNVKHEGITRHDKREEERRREILSMESTALQAMGSEQMLARVEMAKFPQDLTPQEKRLLAQVAITYGFDPLMGEITLYQGRPYVSIDGRYRKAQETGMLDGVSTRPATEQEKIDWEIPDGDYFYHSEVYVKGASHPFVGWGRVYHAETTPGSRKPGDTTSKYKPVQSNPQRQTEKRAEAQALRKAFHIPLPSVEDIGSPEEPFVEGELVKHTTLTFPKPRTADLTEKYKDKVDPEGLFITPDDATKQGTGEQAGENTAEQAGSAVTAGSDVGKGKVEKPARDLSLLKTKTDLYKALHADFGLQPNESLKELGLSNWTDLAISLQDAYNQVAAPRLGK